MKRTVKLLGLLLVVAMVISSMVIFVACDNGQNDTKEYTVTFYDGESVLKTENVKEGEKVESWTPSKDGYTFEGWYATPNFSHKFDFDSAISENKSVFAQWSSAQQSADTRDFYILGSGSSKILAASNWGKVFDETTKMTKAADKNEYTYTVDLQKGDQFQFAINDSWHNQRGFGYLETLTLEDGTEVFSGTGTLGENAAYRMNIKCELAGNYTFTLTTHPDDDTYEKTNASYSESNKEAFNINPLDSITWVRNGDVSETSDVVTTYYIKGAKITNWKDFYNNATQLVAENGVHTLSVYLREGEQFMFTSLNTIDGESSVGTEYLRGSNLDDAAKAYITTEGGDMFAKASGTYTFTYTESTKVLSVTFDKDNVPVATDYYIDGTFAEGVKDWSGYCFNNDYKLVETSAGSGIYELKGVSLKADSQIIVQAFKAGATERGEWGTAGYNGLGSYNYFYLYGGGEAFSAVGGGNNNIKVLTAGVYDIKFDSYSKMLTIESANTIDDAYIVGAMTGNWSVQDDWKMTLDDGKYTITKSFAVGDEFGVRVMKGNSTEQRVWVGKSNVNGTPEGFDLSGGNIKCTVAGEYTITCVVTDGVGVITIVAASK